jgi:hypothetical protein
MIPAECGIIASTSIYSLQSTQDFVVKEQLVPVLYRPSPGLVRSVSGERIAPSGCSRIATATFFNIVLPAKLAYNGANRAGPQSAEPQALAAQKYIPFIPLEGWFTTNLLLFLRHPLCQKKLDNIVSL